VEIEVTVLFCDVRGFTEFASQATPQEVVAALNELFECAVPIIAEHGGHIDKFEGDGLLAVFGAPEPFPDHADRASHAACEIARAVNHEHRGGELRVGIGVNSGPVIAGAIGGGGRLNFSVIGGVVNVASRVEEHTRVTGDDILITAETWTALSHHFEVESRGKVELRGVAEPVALYAPQRSAEPAATGDGAVADGDGSSGRRLRLPLPRMLR
jgi:class 3 adenylate cyclase